ncbi:hypothetical protein N7490_001097 [Penicillium lividum]|nr:hypothetical protein N7490_001097 [Penicillium lividum]
MIWKHALQYRRIIRIDIKGIEQKDEPDIIITKFNDTYNAVLRDSQIFNNLLRVNSESRNIAKAFYRVEFPCMLENITGDLVQGALHEKYINEDPKKAIKPAFGFWLFPLKTICAWPLEEEELDWPWPKICTLANGDWPALALS